MTVYILHSEKLSRFYTGFTTDLEVRLKFHENAEQRKFTYNADDWEIYHTIICQSKAQALKIEKHIKRMKSKIYIQNLKKHPEINSKLLIKYKDC
ncbi:MAG: excinuclease subunit [Crocinitomicaceae bacterium]|jgi:putative endonuclease|nr:excinuclease subunit [Crocinitomicaceae bacterium]